ncbi:hypothetical protein MNBD_GAMMA18-1798 [hydrothermal vent metagenome]|uniref:Uncharacterized protein n=1 Tax=hydrothermal vent metagenome TaxID=652676 RepID=A0A3B0ZDP0_9ZZZZ
MKKKIAFGGIGGIFLIYVGLMLYVMTQMEMKVLILCSENQGGIRIPSNLCKYYLVNYRMNEKDIKELSEGAGLDYILYIEGKNSTEYELAKLFLAKGLNVDGVNHYTPAPPNDNKFTPLQSAVVMNDMPRVKFLLDYGADIHLSEGYGMTPIDIARKFHKTGSERQDRTEIIQILSDAEKP